MYKRTHKQQLEEASRKRLFTFDLVIPCAPMFKPLVVPFADQSFISAIDPNTFSNLLCCPLFEDVEKSSWYHEMQHDEQQST